MGPHHQWYQFVAFMYWCVYPVTTQDKLLYIISHNIEVYEKPVLQTKKIPHRAAKFKAGEENGIEYGSLYYNTQFLNSLHGDLFVPMGVSPGPLIPICCMGVVIFVTARKWSLGQLNVFTPVCQSFCSRGVSAPLHAGIHIPLGRYTSRQTHPLPGY